jgi:hypothetical protein
VPTGFLEEVVARENGSVIRVVAYILSRTLEGEEEVTASWQDFMEQLKLSRQAVQEGLNRALAAGYIRIIRRSRNQPTCYSLNWQREDPEPPPENSNSGHTSGGSKEAGATLQKVAVGYPDHTISAATTASSPAGTGSGAFSPGKPLKSVNQTAGKITTTSSLTGKSSFPTTGSNISNNSNYLNKLEPELETRSETEKESGRHAQPVWKLAKPRSAFLTGLTADFSGELGDLQHLLSNTSQTHNLWRGSGLSEEVFAGLMYQARAITRQRAVLRPGEAKSVPGTPRNRGAYFFTVLRNLVSAASTVSFHGTHGAVAGEYDRVVKPIHSGYPQADSTPAASRSCYQPVAASPECFGYKRPRSSGSVSLPVHAPIPSDLPGSIGFPAKAYPAASRRHDNTSAHSPSHSRSQPATNASPSASNGGIDWSKYAPGGKYGYLVHHS